MDLNSSKLWILFVVTALTTSCSTVRLFSNDVLDGTTWTLQSTGAGQVIPAELSLNFSEGQARGSAGCNRFQGGYSITDKHITFTDLNMTLMACADPDIMAFEQIYFRTLSSIRFYQMEEGRLILITGDGHELRYIRIN